MYSVAVRRNQDFEKNLQNSVCSLILRGVFNGAAIEV